MRKSTRFSVLALVAGFALLVGACSSDGAPPEGLAFQEDSSGDQQEQNQEENAPPVTQEDPNQNSQEDGGQGEVDETATSAAPDTTEAPATTEAAPTTVPGVARPTNRTCSTSDHSVAFGADVILQANGGTTSGPYSVNVPAGTYEITMSTWLGFEEDSRQTMEQWYFTTDSSYTSPLTTDSSPDLIFTNAFGAQTVPAATSVTLHHKGGTAVENSVHPLCIGFRAVAAPATTAAPTTTAAPATTAATETTAVAAPATTAAPAVTTAPATAPAELALTGASELSLSLGLTGAALMLAGTASLIAARRNEED